MPVLTKARNEKSCRLYTTGFTACDAYVSAGYKPNGAQQAASRLLRNVKVAARISELQQAAEQAMGEAAAISRERVLNRLSLMSVAAEKAGEYAVAIRAEELIGKHFRMFPNQNEHSGPEGKPIETIDLSKYTAEEIETLERISERVNRESAKPN